MSDIMSAHTPGPWRTADLPTRATGVFGIRDGGTHQIARVWTGEADARLIAAAPALLQALKDAVLVWDYVFENDAQMNVKFDPFRALLARIEEAQ
jgi:hypothetical protein